MVLSSDAAALMFSTVYIVLQMVIIAELIFHNTYNGPILKSLTACFVTFTAVVCFPLVGRLDILLDISPGWDLTLALKSSVWAAYAAACVPSICLWYFLHTEHRRAKK